jgi:type I restriction enzyme, S subunit
MMGGSHEGTKTRRVEKVEKRLKFIAPLRNERTDATSDHSDYLGLENIQSWTGKLLPNTTSDISESDDSASGTTNVFYLGDVLFGKLRPYLAKALHADKNGVCSTELLVLKPKPDIHPRFLLYSMLSPDFVGQVDASTFGAKMPRANWEFIGSMKLPVPAYEFQRLIADYLDRETARIDALVAEKEKMLALLEEKRAALISRAVTRGLDPNAPLKPSGLDWLGDIPAHWETRRCATLFQEIDERSCPDLPLLNVSLNTGVTLRVFSDDRIESVAADFSSYKVARKGDLVFNKMRFWQGAAGIAPEDGLTSPDYTVARFGSELDSGFVGLLVRLPLFSNEVRRYSYGMVDDRLRLYWMEFRNLRMPVPPLSEQRTIIETLHRECDEITDLAGLLQQSISLAIERRAALITAAVTGQIPAEEMRS